MIALPIVAVTIALNSSKNVFIVLAPNDAIPRPNMNAETRAVITPMIGVISMVKNAGNSIPSVLSAVAPLA